MSQKRKVSNELNGSIFLMIHKEMRESVAWFALPDDGRRVLDRLEIEHMRQGGAENGSLLCTYRQFEVHGIRKASIPLAIAQCKALGFLDIQSYAFAPIYGRRPPSKYRLTYLDGTKNSCVRTDEWGKIKTHEEASRRLSEVMAKHGDKRRARMKREISPRDIDSRRAGVPRL